ncbi:DMT family transporter [Marinicella rhabdoformis]|uniref:DMT family transporter n=1 Tax=Marinicella rhabdoformis TaxID=2580566 RepID=UPI0012AEDD71|nr:DMT family transporter [Marinicella rhabdoformis]
MNIRVKNALTVIVVMFLWAICYPLITIGLEHAPHITFAACRASIAGVILLLIGYSLGKPHPRGILLWLLLVLIGIGATTIGFYGMFHASEFLAPGIATVITNLQPMLTAVLAYWFLSEKMSMRQFFAISMGFVGILIITSNNFPDNSNVSTTGIIYLLIAITGLSVSNLLIKKITGQIDALIAMGWQLIFGSVFLWLLAISTENQRDIDWTIEFIISLSGLSLLGTSLAYWLWFKALEQVDLVFANAFSFLAPAFGISIGILFFNETFSMTTVIGLTVIFTGIVLINLPQKGTNNAA